MEDVDERIEELEIENARLKQELGEEKEKAIKDRLLEVEAELLAEKRAKWRAEAMREFPLAKDSPFPLEGNTREEIMNSARAVQETLQGYLERVRAELEEAAKRESEEGWKGAGSGSPASPPEGGETPPTEPVAKGKWYAKRAAEAILGVSKAVKKE